MTKAKTGKILRHLKPRPKEPRTTNSNEAHLKKPEERLFSNQERQIGQVSKTKLSLSLQSNQTLSLTVAVRALRRVRERREEKRRVIPIPIHFQFIHSSQTQAFPSPPMAEEEIFIKP
ncbi:hypothetical protein L484_020149 [Morus notabilis]|uniref:Uncharacterized protein n=1 Tax=Morus notabilis TaxID=981085 RepID=W9QY97_9ROSA|nr:hypothetical protein L484_020149 [Morus notabilis]